MSKDSFSLIRRRIHSIFGCWLFFELSFSLELMFSLADFEMLDQLPFRDFSSASLAFEVRAALVRVKMLFLVGDLIKGMVAAVDWALEGFFSGVRSQVVEEALRLLEELSALSMVARVHGRPSLSVRKRVAQEFELGEETGVWKGKLLLEGAQIQGLSWDVFDIGVLCEAESFNQAF